MRLGKVIRVRRFLALFVVFVATHRCNETEVSFPEYFSFENEYLLQVNWLEIDRKRVPLTVEPARGINYVCGEYPVFRVCVNPDVHKIVVEVSNLSTNSISIPWSDARIVDDTGVVRRVDTEVVNSTLPASLEFLDRVTTVPPRWSSADAVWAEGKIYYASVNSKNAYVMYEPLVPGTLTGSREQDRAVLRQIADRQVAMKLIVPLIVQGDPIEMEATFKLVNRAEAVARYQSLLSNSKN